MLELDGLRKRYDGTTALDDCSFTVRRGRLTGFLGPNGAGKTTAMRAIFGLVEPDEGQVRWRGAVVDRAARRTFGYMPEERGVYPKMRTRDQVVYFARLAGLSPAHATTAADGWLERLGLVERANDAVEALSHGNQQRVQLAIALVHRPALLVLDEPFSGLDPLAVEAMLALLREAADDGAAVLFSSHQLDLVEDLCEDVVVIDRGRVVLAGVLDDLRNAAPKRSFDIVVRGANSDWLGDLPGVDILTRENGHARLMVDRDVDPAELVSRAHAAGSVARLEYAPPTLSELFREAVSP